MVTRIIFVLATLAVAACANKSVPDKYQLSSSSGEGLATGSITIKGDGGLFGVFLRANESGKVYRAEVGSQSPNIVEVFAPSLNVELGLPGGVFAVALPAGAYSIAGWYATQGETTWTPEGRVKVEFDVVAGQAAYLGNFNFVEGNRTNALKRNFSLTLEDMRDRDLPILVKHYATLATSHTYTALSPDAKLENLGSPSHQRPAFVVPAPQP